MRRSTSPQKQVRETDLQWIVVHDFRQKKLIGDALKTDTTNAKNVSSM